VTNPMIIAVDGPAGSGKSSICNKVAEQFNWCYLNTGMMYRAVGWMAIKRGFELSDDSSIGALVDEFAKNYSWSDQSLLINNANITAELGSPEVSRAASAIARLPSVRKKLLPVQRDVIAAAPRGIIVDGRDIGTVVCPDADLKVFMTASLLERARRRLKQLEDNNPGYKGELAQIMDDISGRDLQDQQRGQAPLRKADDAIEFDNSDLTIENAVKSLVELIKERT
jgi:CMP/dCMP kinase